MTDNERLNFFIENYLKDDKSQRALLLTGPWGTGKSFYIKNMLCPHLKSKKLDFAVISLYGICSLSDLSKSIYLEIRTKNLLERSEKANITWVLGKTIVKGVASFFNVDISQNDKDLKRLYKSIDLSNRLIVLEDLERAGMDLIEVLGFVNNLVEQDGAKVLLVANEDELVKFEEKTIGDKKVMAPTETSERYLKIKEKTIGDTIKFRAELVESISNIIRSFDDPIFERLMKEKDPNGDPSLARRICQQLTALSCYNLRSVLYACQKMHEITARLETPLNLSFLGNLFIGTTVYSARIGNGFNRGWEGQALLSQSLGSFAYPLYKVMYDYLEHQFFCFKNFKDTEQAFLEWQKISDGDDKLKVIFNYCNVSELELKHSLDSILKMLRNDSGIVRDEYTKVANYLISIKHSVGFESEIDECLNLMLKNAKRAIDEGQKVKTFATSGIELATKEENDEYQTFTKTIENYERRSTSGLSNFAYEPGKIGEFYDEMLKKEKGLFLESGFANKFDCRKILSMLRESTSEQIATFRHLLHYVYFEITGIVDYFLCDLSSIREIQSGVKSLVNSTEGPDKIQKLQLKWLSMDLDRLINALEKVGSTCGDASDKESETCQN